MARISKMFGDDLGIADFSLHLEKGTIHGVLGESCAGKTTLARILGGLISPDSGSLCVEGKEVKSWSPRIAAAMGIGKAGEESPYVNGLNLIDHLRLGSEFAPGGKLKKRNLREQAVTLCDKYGIPLDMDQRADEMSRTDWLWAEVLRMVQQEKHILVLDEPDTIFTRQEMDKLIAALQKLCQAGSSVLLFSRFPETILSACQQVTVLIPDAPAETYLASQATAEDLNHLMHGENAEAIPERKEVSLGGIALEVRRLTVRDDDSIAPPAHELSFEARSGEIVCLLGRSDQNSDALAAALIGAKEAAEGRIKLNGKDVSRASVRERLQAGMAYLPRDVRALETAEDLTLEENLALHRYRDFQESGWIRRGPRREEANQILQESGVPDRIELNEFPETMDVEALRLLMLSRELERKPVLLIADEPTRHVSEKAAALIRERLLSVRADHRAVLLLTSQPEEAMALADRILVLHEGEIMGEFDPAYTSVRELGWYISGQWRQQRYGGRAIEGEDE